MATAAEKKAAEKKAADEAAAAAAQAEADQKAADEAAAQAEADQKAADEAAAADLYDADAAREKAAAEDKAAADAAAAEAERAGLPEEPDVVRGDVDTTEFADAEPPLYTEQEKEDSKTGAVRGVGVAVAASPLSLPEPAENPATVTSDPNVPAGLDNVVEAYANRGDNSTIAAEDGSKISADDLFEDADASGMCVSKVRLVEHSHLEPYGHEVTVLVVGAGVPVSPVVAEQIKKRVAEQDNS